MCLLSCLSLFATLQVLALLSLSPPPLAQLTHMYTYAHKFQVTHKHNLINDHKEIVNDLGSLPSWLSFSMTAILFLLSLSL